MNAKARLQNIVDWARCWAYCLFSRRRFYPSRATMIAEHGWHYVDGEYFMDREHCDGCLAKDTIAAHAVDFVAGTRATFRPQRRPFFGWRPTDSRWVVNKHGRREPHNFYPEMAGGAWTLK